ncbi:terminase large subunit domain-containing protein, partial [Bacillus cereus]|uniref:terminase large subunit domain-containing protein n=1 Tax=Bacillus cereus TaxID=1396 RepID=UPI003012C56E
MIRQWMLDYCDDVVNDEVVACQKHKQACKRFLRDIEREGSEDFPYVFKEEKALRFLKWMSLFKHTKGKLAGQRMEPHSIQIFVFSNIYGWVHRNTGLRRFKKAYWQVGRKNAKSQSLACVGSYEAMAFGENMSEVYIGATKTEQSKIVWNEIKAQMNGCEDLKGKFNIAYGKIEHLKTDSFISALSKDAGKSGDGLNVQCGIIDEYHAHPTSEIYDVLVSGSGARPNPLMMIITTAGFNLSHPCYRVEYQYVSKILDQNIDIENEEYFVMVNELDKDDEITNPEV